MAFASISVVYGISYRRLLIVRPNSTLPPTRDRRRQMRALRRLRTSGARGLSWRATQRALSYRVFVNHVAAHPRSKAQCWQRPGELAASDNALACVNLI